MGKPLAVGDFTNHDLTRSLPSPCDLNFGLSQNERARERLSVHDRLGPKHSKTVQYCSSGMALDSASGEKPLGMGDALLDEERFECACRPPPSLLAARRKVADQYIGAKLGESAPKTGNIDVLTKHMMWSTWRSSVQKAAQRLELVHCLFAVEIRSLEGSWFNPFAPSQECVASATEFCARLRASSRAQHDADWNKLFELLQVSVAMTRKEHTDILNAVCVSNRTEPWCQAAILVERLHLEYASATGESAGLAYDAIIALSRTSPSKGIPYGAHLERISQAVNVYLAVHAGIPSAPPLNMMTIYANVLRSLSSASAPDVWRSHAGTLLQAWNGGRNEAGPVDVLWLEGKLRTLTTFDLAVTGGEEKSMSKRTAAAGSRGRDHKAKGKAKDGPKADDKKGPGCYACGLDNHGLLNCRNTKKVRELLKSVQEGVIPDTAKGKSPADRIIEHCEAALKKAEEKCTAKQSDRPEKKKKVGFSDDKGEVDASDSDEERGSRRRRRSDSD